jgi:hypothetical protein
MSTTYVGDLLADTDYMRKRIVDAFDSSIPMHMLQRQGTLNDENADGLCLYVGLWGAWWLNNQIKGLKVIIVTARWSAFGPNGAPTHTKFGSIPWFIAQLQTLDNEHPKWDAIYTILSDDIQLGAETEEIKTNCRARVTYNPTQATHNVRQIAHPNVLAEMHIKRREESGHNIQPTKTLERDTVSYVLLFNATDGQVDPVLNIFVERDTPKIPHMGNAIHQEKGLVKDSSLLSAIGEWRTWLVLGT